MRENYGPENPQIRTIFMQQYLVNSIPIHLAFVANIKCDSIEIFPSQKVTQSSNVLAAGRVTQSS